MESKSKRLANIELLRIIAMLMVIMLHYLGKGELLPTMNSSMDALGYVAWIFESLSIVAVNVYVLISGYFMVSGKFRVGKIIELICQVLFYAVGVTILAYSLGFIERGDITVSALLQQLFSLHYNQYWFVTAYIVLYMFSPVLAIGIQNMSKKQLEICILLLLVFNCLVKSISPISLAFDKKGYDVIWFVCLFMVAGYIRLYGIKTLEKKRYAIGLYVLGVVFIFLEGFVLGTLYAKTGSLGETIGVSYHYNHIFCFLASVGLFTFFLQVKIPEGKIATIICKISPYTLGVYLLHEQIYVRYVWPELLGAKTATNVVTFIVYANKAVFTVFVVGVIVDWLRSLLFRLVKKIGVN